MKRAKRSARPFWLGEDRRQFDHVRVHLQVIRDPRLTSYELAVYLGLVAHAEVSTGLAGPSEETLASYAQCSVRRTRMAIRTLERAGYVATTPNTGHASTYVLLPPPDLFHSPASQAGHPGTDPGSRRFSRAAYGAAELEQDQLQEPQQSTSSSTSAVASDGKELPPRCPPPAGWRDGLLRPRDGS